MTSQASSIEYFFIELRKKTAKYFVVSEKNSNFVLLKEFNE